MRRFRFMTRPRRSNLFPCIAITALALIIIISLIILISWVVVRPAPIEYTVENAQIHNFNQTSSYALNATFDLNLRAANRNHKVSIYYDSIEVTVWYSDQMVALADVTPFFQARRNVTKIDISPVAPSVPLMGSVAGNWTHDQSVGEAELEVRVKARIRFKVGVIKSKHYTLSVYCSPVWVHFSSSAPFERVYCDVDVRVW